MIAHVVMFRPRGDLTSAAQRTLAAAFEAALSGIPVIRRARVGRRVTTGRSYESLMRSDYPFAVVLEFDDRLALAAYLDHPAHAELARQFFDAFEDALIYDFDLSEGTAGLAGLLPQ